jgi:hypothetical protein
VPKQTSKIQRADVVETQYESGDEKLHVLLRKTTRRTYL